MKTSSFRRPKRLLSGAGSIAVGAVAFFILLLVFLRLVFPGALAVIADPLWRMGSTAAARVSLPQSTAALEAEIAALTAENERLTNEALVGQATTLRIEGVQAGVLARPPITPYDLLVVSAGTTDGVSVGALTYAPGGIPVGTVEEVSASRSRVLLYSASGRTSEGWIGEVRTPLTLIGAGAGSFDATVPSDLPITVGDTVYLPGPGALPIGSVARIDTNAASARSTLHIRPLANPFTLTEVTIAPL